MKEKLVDIIKKIIKSKRVLYLVATSILILFCLVLNITFSAFTAETNINNANITVGKLKYQMIINDVVLSEEVGTSLKQAEIIGDRIIKLKAREGEIFNVVLTNLNSLDTRYEITYDVCSDVNCTDFIDIPSDLVIYYNSGNDLVKGTIETNKERLITLVSHNNTENDYYVQINLEAGYIHNAFVYKNQIGEINIDGITVLAYVNGRQVSNFPTTNEYIAEASCKSLGVNDKLMANVVWSGAEWLLNIASINSGNTICEVYFEASEYPAPNGWFSLKEGTLLYAIKRDNILNESGTIPGEVVSTSTEKRFASTEDDYGTTFYFRGAVENNFVEFAGMCWRIVRVTGNGAIKLVLYNRNESGAASPCSSTGSNLAFAKYNGSSFMSVFNASNSAYSIGFMHPGANGSTYEVTHANLVDSIILANLKTWYDTALRSYNDMLADTIWCNDKSLASGTGTTGSTTYGGHVRLYNSNASPTLICPDAGSDGKISKFTASDSLNGNAKLISSITAEEYKIGLLTADEVVYAGSKWDTENKTFYLYKNATSNSWVTLTPRGGGSAFIYSITTSGSLYANDDFITSKSYAVRPAISLKSNTTISGGDGTVSTPYVVIS